MGSILTPWALEGGILRRSKPKAALTLTWEDPQGVTRA
eukprot:CAMPEP_0180206934 /NCGR_PEP_ID=MMETSP0987-20121128/9831_1 /TAXON_ID=697907 /ORGANISM="non described non described, Strain CCMP2293" /LENGTH=37 /DNA_ID= /DNA_START= /DNA_END= /DNA_ORIENTATION=